jgi:N-acetylmuramoyl-L-alanine amidase
MRKLILFILFAFPLMGFSSPIKAKPLAYSAYSSQEAPIVVIDAGHGGLDLGARARNPFCEEKRIALICAKYVKKYLDQLGYRVILTRTNDVFLPLPRRVHIANHSRCQLFVSIHFNSSPNKEASGLEIFYCEKQEEVKQAQASKRLATSILNDIIKKTKAKSRGVKKGNFFVIRESKVPAVLVEGGFISNSYERSMLRDKEYLEKLGRGIADGVDKYLKG